jgi:V/A-type H+-transporting ATPase subunit D
MTKQAPSKTELLERRAERELVREGKTVLEERRDLLAQLMLEQIAITESLYRQRDRLFDQVRGQVRRAAMRHGLTGIERHASDATTVPDPGWYRENRLGIHWLGAKLPQTPATPRVLPSGLDVSLELAAAVAALQELLDKLLRLAQAESNLSRLIDFFRRTQRRVNALDHIILPEIERDIKDIEDIMDEMERGDLVRSLLIKRAQDRDAG